MVCNTAQVYLNLKEALSLALAGPSVTTVRPSLCRLFERQKMSPFFPGGHILYKVATVLSFTEG